MYDKMLAPRWICAYRILRLDENRSGRLSFRPGETGCLQIAGVHHTHTHTHVHARISTTYTRSHV